MTLALLLIALLTLGPAVLAISRRNLIHSALLLIGSWFGVAGFYLWAGAEFVAFAQVLIYVGAVSMVVLFDVLLTRQNQISATLVEPASRSRAATGSILTAACVGAIFAAAILSSSFHATSASAPASSVRRIGLELMHRNGATLLIVGVILTV